MWGWVGARNRARGRLPVARRVWGWVAGIWIVVMGVWLAGIITAAVLDAGWPLP